MKFADDRSAIKHLMEQMQAKGFHLLEVQDGEEDAFPIGTIEQALEDLMTCDDGYLIAMAPDNVQGWVYFVFGNDPEEVVCDYTTNLDPWLSEITDEWDL